MPTGPTSFPTSLDSFPTVLSTTQENDSGFEHDLIHDWEMTALAALQAKVGADSSAVTTSLDYKVGRVITSTTGAITGSTARTVPVTNGGGFRNNSWLYVTDGTNSLYGQISSGGGTTTLTVSATGMVIVGTANSIATGSPVVLAGAPGATGSQGPQGAQGAQGFQGPQGAVGREAGLKYTYLTATTTGDPGAGNFKFNAAPSSATVMRISTYDGDTNQIATLVDSWYASTNSNKCTLFIRNVADPTAFLSVQITGGTTGPNYRTLNVSYLNSSGTLADLDECRVEFSPIGDAGLAGPQGTQGFQGPQGSAGAQGAQGTQGTSGGGGGGGGGLPGPPGLAGEDADEAVWPAAPTSNALYFKRDDIVSDGTSTLLVLGAPLYNKAARCDLTHSGASRILLKAEYALAERSITLTTTPTYGDTLSVEYWSTQPIDVDTIFGINDPYWSSVVFLSHFDGTNGAITYTEETGKTPHYAGSSAGQFLSSAQAKFGSTSLDARNNSATNGRFSALNSSDFAFGTGDLTVELFAYFASTAGGVLLNAGDGTTGWFFQYTSGTIYFGSIGVYHSVSWTPTVNTWYHLAWTRSGSTNRVFVDGTQIGSNVTDSTSHASSADLQIGYYQPGGPGFFVDGYLDEIRLTKGVARYTSNFTPPVAAFPNS